VPLPVCEESLSPRLWRLLYLGRMDVLKGGQLLLEALPRVQSALGGGGNTCPPPHLHVTFAGDGPSRSEWEHLAAQLRDKTPGVTTEFPGWVDGTEIEELWARCDLAVVPSLWPEPFGLVGPEAVFRGVPLAAFAVGGIPEWLSDGVNGHLAPGDPPTAGGLAEAIVKCLRDPQAHAALRRGAATVAARLGGQDHLTALERIFANVAGSRYRECVGLP
jgi:glycosyltransferase involved in cell wall biosynthesis